jgi:hypothetical protein
MGLHNLVSEDLVQLSNDVSGQLEKAMQHGWIEEVLDTYASLPEVPLGNELGALSHVIAGFRGLFMKSAQSSYMKKADLLLEVVKMNEAHRLAVYIEFVDEPDFATTVSKYTVWKGTLFSTLVKGRAVVCWHPDKDFKPVQALNVLHTQYSELGRRQRRRETA